MRHIPRSISCRLQRFPESGPDPVTYQTNPNPSKHSKSVLLRLTLVTLWNLRVPPIVRTIFIALLAVPFLALSAGASRVDATRTATHAPTSKSNLHRVHRSTRSVSHSPKAVSHSAHGAPRTGSASFKSHRPPRYSSSSRRPTRSSRYAAGLHRARLSTHNRARFTTLATVPISPRSRSRLETDSENPGSQPEVDRPVPSPEADLTSSESNAPDRPAPAAGDVAVATGSSPSAAAAGNPLAAPPVATSAPAASSQVAELHLPRFPQNLHINSYALRGTHDSLVRQNERSEEEALERIEDDADLQDRIARGMLVRVPESAALSVNPELPADRRYCRSWTADFLADLSRAHNAAFHKPLTVSSAVRTVEYQKQLMRTNHNAADAEGDVVSPHLTGATIDIAKSGLSRKEMQWMRNELLAYQKAGVIDVEEEFRQRCFHITVYKNYDSVSPHKPATDAATPAAPASLPAGPGDASVQDQ